MARARWEASVVVGVNPDGTPQYRKFTGRSRAEVVHKLEVAFFYVAPGDHRVERRVTPVASNRAARLIDCRRVGEPAAPRDQSSPTFTRGVLATVLGAALMFAGVVAGSSASGAPVGVTICHRTNSVDEPYTLNTVNESAVNDPSNSSDHLSHAGAVFDFTADPDIAYPTPRNGDQWGDIVPPFDETGAERPDPLLVLNWPAGQAIFEAGCKNPATTTTTSPTSTSTTSSSTTSTSTTSTSTTSTSTTSTSTTSTSTTSTSTTSTSTTSTTSPTTTTSTPPTTTASPTTTSTPPTTTAPPTTTSTPPTTTAPPTTTTSVAGQAVVNPTVLGVAVERDQEKDQEKASPLAFTGSRSRTYFLAGLGLVLLGAALIGVSRRRGGRVGSKR